MGIRCRDVYFSKVHPFTAQDKFPHNANGTPFAPALILRSAD